MSRPGELDARGRRLRAALAAVLVPENAPELRLMHPSRRLLAFASVRRRVESLFVLPDFTPIGPTFVCQPFHRHVSREGFPGDVGIATRQHLREGRMDVDRSYIERNSSSLRRLRALIGGLHDDDFNRNAGGGWTIGAVLAHVAFWDRYVTTRLSRWEKQGFESTPLDPDSINDAALPAWRAIPGRLAASEALAAAQECDGRTAGVAEVLAAAILAAGRLRVLDRSIHRGEHIDQIERALR